MNTPSGAHDHHQKDFLNSFFPPDQSHPEHDQHARNADMYHNAMTPGSTQHQAMINMQQQHLPNAPVNLDVLELMAMQERAGQSSSGGQNGQATSPQMLLEQQVRLNQLQQLQQLQNQIFQQQIELLTGNNGFSGALPGSVDRSRDQQQYGLPTPASSTELLAQHDNDFVSPMMLQSSHGSGNNISTQQTMPQSFIPQHLVPPTPHSAPANIVFQQSQSPQYAQDLEFAEISPLTSPWLGAYNHNGHPDANGLQSGQRQMGPSGSPNNRKRRPSPGSGEEDVATARPSTRKRAQPGPANRMTPSMPPLLSTKKSANLRGTRSANSTPLFPASSAPGSRISPVSRNPVASGEIPGDTPSPVDLSMPPPAPPSTSNSPLQFVEGHSTSPPLDMHGHQHNQSMNNQIPQQSQSQQPQPHSHQQQQQHPHLMASEHLMPVTPASIMNLGRLGTNSALAPPSMAPQGMSQEKPVKGKPTGRARASTLTQPKATNSSLPLISPSLKPIRPAGGASGTSTPTTPITQPTLAGRKTSHKAAEQKRRDSLKTSFDELRILLPPIPLPSDEGYPDEPVLPGAMPPRGPPKGNADGPNRGVSKLQLLRCGNDFIRVLKARVDRRDSEIDILRKEISRLRLVAGDNGQNTEDGEELDLEKDMDAVETAVGGIFARGSVRFGAIAEGDEPDDDE